jgi:hypothetical protein
VFFVGYVANSLGLARFDALQLQRTVEVWFQQHVRQHWSTDYIRGKGVQTRYGVNDMAIVRWARDYPRVESELTFAARRDKYKNVHAPKS